MDEKYITFVITHVECLCCVVSRQNEESRLAIARYLLGVFNLGIYLLLLYVADEKSELLFFPYELPPISQLKHLKENFMSF